MNINREGQTIYLLDQSLDTSVLTTIRRNGFGYEKIDSNVDSETARPLEESYLQMSVVYGPREHIPQLQDLGSVGVVIESLDKAFDTTRYLDEQSKTGLVVVTGARSEQDLPYQLGFAQAAAAFLERLPQNMRRHAYFCLDSILIDRRELLNYELIGGRVTHREQ